MIYSHEVQHMCVVKKGANHQCAPIPEEGKWVRATQISDISGLTHGIGWCAPKQGGCKLTLNVKEGIIQEALVETIGCSGMTHSAAMASEILPGKTLLEALNTDLVCDAINTAMRELFLQIVYGRTQSAFSEGGLPVGAGLEDLGKGLRSQVGTMFGTLAKGPRYLEMAEGYCTRMALDADDEVIGYEFIHLGKFMDMVKKGANHQCAPIPEEGKWVRATQISDISGLTHGIGWCAPKQGGCKLTLNVKEGIIQEALVETIGCSGMTHSAAMASEILPGKTLLEALNTDLVCDAINTAMRELFLQIVYGRTQSAFSEGGLPVGAGLEDLGKGLRSQVGTMFGTLAKGPRYLEMAEGYCTRMALDADDEVIGYEFIHLGKFMDMVKKGMDANEALEKAKGSYGRFKEAVKYIDPRNE